MYLGYCINALANNSKDIPYKNTSLTKLLSDSFCGNSHNLMIATISPGENNFDETLSTLIYASKNQ